MLFLCLATQIILLHVFKMSAVVTYSCLEWCTPLVNGFVDCALFNAVLTFIVMIERRDQRNKQNIAKMLQRRRVGKKKTNKQIKTHETYAA